MIVGCVTIIWHVFLMVASNTKQVKSRERVQQHGEVFTNEREVNAMLDLVKHETERIDSRFLEPACGDGNFLAEILRRKLQVCRKFVEQGKNTQLEYEKNAVLAVSSIYGIELLTDNAMACREPGTQQSSLNGMMLALQDVTRPAGIPADYETMMIIG